MPYSVLLLFCSTASLAEIPKQGLWLVPDEPGSGISIAYQHGTLVAVIYTYDPETRAANYLIGSSPYVEGEAIITFQQKSGGSCLWCEFEEGMFEERQFVATLRFSDLARGTIAVEGGLEKNIRYFEFNSDSRQLVFPPDEFGEVFVPDLFGSWVFASEDDSVLLKATFFDLGAVIETRVTAFFGGSAGYLECQDPDEMGFDEVICTLIGESGQTPLARFPIEGITTERMEGVVLAPDGAATDERVVGVRVGWPIED